MAWFPVSLDVSFIGAVCMFVPLSMHYMEVYSMFCVFSVTFPRNTFVRLMFEECVGGFTWLYSGDTIFQILT